MFPSPKIVKICKGYWDRQSTIFYAVKIFKYFHNRWSEYKTLNFFFSSTWLTELIQNRYFCKRWFIVAFKFITKLHLPKQRYTPYLFRIISTDITRSKKKNTKKITLYTTARRFHRETLWWLVVTTRKHTVFSRTKTPADLKTPLTTLQKTLHSVSVSRPSVC